MTCMICDKPLQESETLFECCADCIDADIVDDVMDEQTLWFKNYREECDKSIHRCIVKANKEKR